jgi:hypothetical protein
LADSSYESPSEYIGHHLSNNVINLDFLGGGSFMTLHLDSFVMAVILGIFSMGLIRLVARKATAGVPTKTQAFVELVFSFIDDEESLSKLCEQLESSKWLAVDTEFERVSTYYPELCLVQVSNGDTTAVIDPITIVDIAPLLNLLYEPSITKVLHSAHQDLEIFFNI